MGNLPFSAKREQTSLRKPAAPQLSKAQYVHEQRYLTTSAVPYTHTQTLTSSIALKMTTPPRFLTSTPESSPLCAGGQMANKQEALKPQPLRRGPLPPPQCV